MAEGLQLEGLISTYAGGGNGDGGPAIDASLEPRGIVEVLGAQGLPDLYIADTLSHRVRHVDGVTGIIKTSAGNGTSGYNGDDLPGPDATLSFPTDVAADGQGNVFIADAFNNRIRRLDLAGIITTVAGNGSWGYSGDEGPAAVASLATPFGVAVGPDDTIYIADSANSCIRKVGPPGCVTGPETCIITTVAGGQWGFGGDGGPATQAKLTNPNDVFIDSLHQMYIADTGNNRIRMVDRQGIIHTIAGTGAAGYAGDGGPATQAWLNAPIQVAVDNAGNIFIADKGNRRVRMIDPYDRYIWTLAGNGEMGSGGDGGPAVEAELYFPYGVAASAFSGDVYISVTTGEAPSQHNRVRVVRDFDIIEPLVGGGSAEGAPATEALIDPRGSDVQAGRGVLPDLYFADGSNNRLRRVDGGSGTIATVAGTGEPGYSGDRGLATKAKLNLPLDVAAYSDGTLFIADTSNNVIRKVSPSGIITTVAGTGFWNYGGDGGPATSAYLATPTGVAIDKLGNLYIADSENYRIRKVGPPGCVISGGTCIIDTVAGNGMWGYAGDGGPATEARLKTPRDVIVATDGSFYIADSLSHRIRRVDPQGIITTYAGNGSSGFSGDFGPAVWAKLNRPLQLSLDAGGNLFIADSLNNRVRRVDAASGNIHTVAGDGEPGPTGDGGSSLAAGITEPSGVATDAAASSLFVSSAEDGRVRLVLFGPLLPPDATPTPTATAPAPTATPTNSAPPTHTATDTKTITPTSTRTATHTGTATRTYTSTSTSTPTRTSTQTRTSTRTDTPTRTQTFTLTATPTRTSTATFTPTDATSGIAGKVRYYSADSAVPAVTVNLYGPENDTIQTDVAGEYGVSGIPQGAWMVEPGKTGDFGAGISALDAARVLQHAVGMITLEPKQQLACDVTGDGTVSAFDAARILQFNVGLLAHFPVTEACGSDWLFLPDPAEVENQLVIDPEIGGGECRRGGIAFNPLAAPAQEQNFSAILFGDCTGNWTPSGGAAFRMTSTGAPIMHAGRLRQSRGRRVRVPIYVQTTRPFHALELQLAYDSSQVLAAGLRPSRAASGALVQHRRDDRGLVTVSLASAQPIDPHRGAVLIVNFTLRRRQTGANPVRLLRGVVDEQPVRVLNHG